MASFELRPARPDEVHEIGELVRRSEAYDGVPRTYSDEELGEDLAASYVDLELDTRVAVVDGDLAGWTIVWHPPAEAVLDRVDVDGQVDPAHRGHGIGRALVAWGVERAQERAAAVTHGLPTVIRAGAPEEDAPRRRLLERFGFEASRYSDELLQPLDDPPRIEPPAGITIRDWPDDRDEELRALRNECFRDHWGSSSIDAELWADLVHGHGHRPDLSYIAVDADDRAVGLSVNWHYPEDGEVTGRKDGIIAILGTTRPWRGRGVASALIARSLAAFVDAGFDHGLIEVDTENPSGAARLYRSLGFEPVRRTVTYLLTP
jgi:ribosomal protein S18 acetylase RimI-like enzyme